MGMYFFKEMPDEEFYEKFPKFSQRNDSINNEKALAELMAKESQIRDPLDTVQYKTIFVPDYNKTESVFIFKAHHSFADGLALITLTCNL